MIEYKIASSAAEYTIASQLFRKYAEWLGIDLGFQDFDNELEHLNSMYALPYGGIILAFSGGQSIGCIAIRKLDEEIAELKRMYVEPLSRHSGIGSGLLQESIRLATRIGYKKIRLDTLNSMENAISLYKKNGFYEIPPYYYNPQPTAVYFEKELSASLGIIEK